MDRYTVLKRTTPNGDEAWFVWDTEERKRMSGDYALWRAAHIEKMRCYAGRLETVRDDFAQRVRRALPIEEEMLARQVDGQDTSDLFERLRAVYRGDAPRPCAPAVVDAPAPEGMTAPAPGTPVAVAI